MPAAAVPAVIAAGVLVGPLPASAIDPLPARTPQEVLLMIAQHNEKSLSGTMEQTSNIGLPALPKTGPGGVSSDTAWLELLTGPHTARVYLDGAENARVQVMDKMAERNAVRRGNELWFYNSKDNTAAHAQLPADAGERHAAKDMPGSGTVPTPGDLAEKLLAKLDPSTDVRVGPDVQVAGRTAYNLVLTPKSTATLVASIAISVDGTTGLPLGVELKARGQSDPAFKVAFTSLTLEAPDSSIFEFAPPPGALVKEIPVPERKAHSTAPPSGMSPEAMAAKRPSVTGTGWESVVGFPAGTVSMPGQATDQAPGAVEGNPLRPDPSLPVGPASGAASLFEQAAVAVPGGRLVSTSLLNVLILDDGRIFAGAVPLERLQSAAAPR
ncbi:LolA family protein [Arthrobacter sp. CG_A4]|uniref:LolA family protein n=1 Tax=Arthrobacter sp. CG_A4 TaxID=3071706 RepID=UPI002E08DB80|nr:outer membrane lipoprotein-sorting protein [Arthrobacter sp. CG_A4]